MSWPSTAFTGRAVGAVEAGSPTTVGGGRGDDAAAVVVITTLIV